MYWHSAGGDTHLHPLETFIIIIICCYNRLPIIVCYPCYILRNILLKLVTEELLGLWVMQYCEGTFARVRQVSRLVQAHRLVAFVVFLSFIAL